MNNNCSHIPKEIDADVAMSVITSCMEQTTGESLLCTYDFEGISERTAVGDALVASIKRTNRKQKLTFSLKRDSMYHLLPEYLFHPLDRYLGTDGNPDEFDKRLLEQQEQKRLALLYFRPFDGKYQDLRIRYQHWLNNNVFSNNQFVADYIVQGSYNNGNPFIRAVIPCFPWIRSYRGNREMVTTSLRMALGGIGAISIIQEEVAYPLTNDVHFSLDGCIDDLFCGDKVSVMHNKWLVKYQTEIATKDKLDKLSKQISDFQQFYQEWFLHVDEVLEISFGDWNAEPILTGDKSEVGVFLNYSTQLI